MSLKDAFRRVQPGEEPPKPPEWLQTWSSQTTYGLLGGMLFGGYRGLLMSRNKQIPSPTANAVTPQHRAAAFFARESILTGSRIGLFVSVFSGMTLTLQSYSPYATPVNYAATGALTCGLFAGAAAGFTAMIPAAGFGAITAAAAAAVQEALSSTADKLLAGDEVEQTGVKMMVSGTNAVDGGKMEDDGLKQNENVGSVAMVISRYEASLEEHPVRQKRNT